MPTGTLPHICDGMGPMVSYKEMIPEEQWQAADANLARLERRIAERGAELETLANSRAAFLQLLRTDRKLKLLKLEHDIVYWRLPEERRARHRGYVDDNYRRRHGIPVDPPAKRAE
jgi:hypothetical protein